ncbi:sulfotransferase ssu-1-like [Ornithodoros turicata]|uniref:sulfotransferase ssu-1-like n=1 Tax=Ornithodoros turicata TaxID=34597 RepID=UPI00313A2A8E
MAVEVNVPDGPTYIDMDGFRLSKNFTLENYRTAIAYRPRPDDLFVVTYPKCGTTWTQHIGYLLFHEGQPPSSAIDFFRSSPFLEMFGAEAVEAMERPGLIKTHLPYSKTPKHPQAKYVYVCRNPKDCCVSFYYHTKGFSGYEFSDGKFEDYFEIFMTGQTDYGDYFDHVLSWYEHRNDPNVKIIHYENMKADPRGAILDMAKFLGGDTYDIIVKNENMLKNIVEYSDIKSMKQHAEKNFTEFFTNPLTEDVSKGVQVFHEVSQKHPGTASFTRKGVVGDWKRHFTEEMNRRMDAKIMERLSGTDFIDLWKKYDVM